MNHLIPSILNRTSRRFWSQSKPQIQTKPGLQRLGVATASLAAGIVVYECCDSFGTFRDLKAIVGSAVEPMIVGISTVFGNKGNIRQLTSNKAVEPMSSKMEQLVIQTQTEMVEALEKIDGGKFIRDSWTRQEGGYGMSCVLQDSNVFEKAGVNVSIIRSPAPQLMLAHMRARKASVLKEDTEYTMFVAGISTVLHPHNPMAPTFHANYRYFELRDAKASQGDAPVASWFGGGCDLTPSYLFEEDAVHFHKTIKAACDAHDPSFYPSFKKWCDNYFNNTHRGERRGIGGIFFDDLEDRPAEELFSFVKDCAGAIVQQYVPIVQKRKDMPFTQQQKEWQQLRRGRYVEFNLVSSLHLYIYVCVCIVLK